MDEWAYAQAVHAHCNVLVRSVFAEPGDFMGTLDEVTKAQEEPFNRPGTYAQWVLMRAIKADGLKVMLDGEGGDEVLCGYAKYVYLNLIELARKRRLLRLAGAGVGVLRHGGRHLLNVKDARRYLPQSWWLERNRQRFFEPSFLAKHAKAGDGYPYGDVVDQQILDLSEVSIPVLLRYEDKNSMCHSIESRVPFLDHRLVEFCLSIPTEYKLVGGLSKRILRDAMGDCLPEKVRRRKSKLGFGGSWHLWIDVLRPQLKAWLDSPNIPLDGYVRREALRRQLEESDPDIFRALSADRWLRLYVA